MSSSSIQFHKIWIDQCEATEGIRETFGLKNALDYLIREKLFNFVQASEQHPEFAAELPAFVAEIRRIFAADEISEYLRHLEQTKFLAPPDIDLETDDVDEFDELDDEPWPKPRPRRRRAPAFQPYPATASSAGIAPSTQPDFRITLPIRNSRPIQSWRDIFPAEIGSAQPHRKLTFLPEVCPSSFLLFVHNPAGATKLRDYSNGRECPLKVRPDAATVVSQTETGRTRFYYEPHRTDGVGVGYWSQVTAELNRVHLSNRLAVRNPPSPIPPQPVTSSNRARRGSQRQLQDYVNEKPELLTQSVIASLPPRLKELGATIRWVSPLVSANYQEYRDRDFLAAIGMADLAAQLEDFWPSMGPCWDALGVISDPAGRLKPGVILVEAKSHINEIYGSGCRAAGPSLEKITRSLAETKQWLAADENADWIGPLYQYANRLAHLYFMLKKVGRPAWLVNLYFVDDPIGPTTEQNWRLEIQHIKGSLGLLQLVPNAVDVFLPSLQSGSVASDDSPISAAHVEGSATEAAVQAVVSKPCAAPRPSTSSEFCSWAQEWLDLASYSGPRLADPEMRIQRLLSLWKEPVPGTWQRSVADTPSRLLNGKRYTRGDEGNPRSGEHLIEHEILCQHFDEVTCLGDSKLIDGVNAFPLVRDCDGGRNGNVEADLLLLLHDASGFRLLIAEVKHSSNNAWFAAVENLRQLRLIRDSNVPRELFARRNPSIDLPCVLPIAGAVIAPHAFYKSEGQKALAVAPARELLAALRAEVSLMVWDASRLTLTTLP